MSGLDPLAWSEWRVLRLPDGSEIRFPAPLHDRVEEGVYRLRERVPVGVESSLIAILDAHHTVADRTGKYPTILSLTDSAFREMLREPGVDEIARAIHPAPLTHILGMWIERRKDDDLPGIRWVEVPDTRR